MTETGTGGACTSDGCTGAKIVPSVATALNAIPFSTVRDSNISTHPLLRAPTPGAKHSSRDRVSGATGARRTVARSSGSAPRRRRDKKSFVVSAASSWTNRCSRTKSIPGTEDKYTKTSSPSSQNPCSGRTSPSARGSKNLPRAPSTPPPPSFLSWLTLSGTEK